MCSNLNNCQDLKKWVFFNPPKSRGLLVFQMNRGRHVNDHVFGHMLTVHLTLFMALQEGICQSLKIDSPGLGSLLILSNSVTLHRLF